MLFSWYPLKLSVVFPMEMRLLFYKDIGIGPLYQDALYRHSFYNEPVGTNLPQKAVHKRCDSVPYYHFY